MKNEKNGSVAKNSTEKETKGKVAKNGKESNSGIFKSGLIKNLVNKVKSLKSKNSNKESQIKDKSAISLSDILSDIDNMTESDIKNICDDINSMNIKVGIDSKAIKLLSSHKDNENVKKLLQNLKSSMDVDVKSISEFRKVEYSTIKNMGCKIGKVYVNSGWDKAAEKGYSADKYEKIVTNAEKMLNKAIGKLPQNASEKDKFMAIYNTVLEAEHYDYSALKRNSPATYTSRNLEGFFLQGKSVCAGTADALKNLCECAGIEMEYVQGMARSKKENRSNYHAWVKAKIDGVWYNADPTWDANKVGKKYEFCLKSDKDFYGHNEDKRYNPTYSRDKKSITYSKTDSTRTYKSANKSINSEDLERQYYSSSIENKKIESQKVSKSDLNYARRHYQPVSNDVAASIAKPVSIKENSKLTFKQKLAEFLSKRKSLKNIAFIQNFIDKNKVIEKELNNIEKNDNVNVAGIQKISKEISQSYIRSINYEKNKKQDTRVRKKENHDDERTR